jgi:hypothetical protein
MMIAASAVKALPRAAAAVVLLALSFALSGCADMSDSMTEAFADPSRYELWNCKQLQAERKSLATRTAELQGLMAKADTGVGGPVVAELAYRNDYVALRGQSRFADQAWRRNNCHETPESAAAATDAPTRPNIKPAPPSRSGAAVY